MHEQVPRGQHGSGTRHVAESGAGLSTGKTLKLRDGRTLGYAEYGDRDGKPVFGCHGTPGSRLDRHPDDEIAATLGVRLIGIDRPGYGLSSFQRGRRLLDWPDDVAQLADALGIRQFAVLGVSGGGPHAAACAYKIPQRLTRVALVSSVCQIDVPGVFAGMAEINRQSFALVRRIPWPVLRIIYARQVRAILRNPEQFAERLATQLPAVDRAILARPDVKGLFMQSLAEAYRSGSRGHAWEDKMVIGRPWRFRPQAITAEVHLWHGEADVLAPVAMGRYLAEAIPNCTARFLPGEGHVSLAFTLWREILTTLAA